MINSIYGSLVEVFAWFAAFNRQARCWICNWENKTKKDLYPPQHQLQLIAVIFLARSSRQPKQPESINTMVNTCGRWGKCKSRPCGVSLQEMINILHADGHMRCSALCSVLKVSEAHDVHRVVAAITRSTKISIIHWYCILMSKVVLW